MTKMLTSEPDKAAQSAARQAWIRALAATKIMEEAPDTTLVGLLDGLAEKFSDRPALLGEGEQLSYRDLAARSNTYARRAVEKGFSPGDVVCLLMPNRPEYVAIWLGLTRAGCVVALLNTNLSAEALLHGIDAAGSSSLIVADSLLPAVAERLPPKVRVWVHGADASGRWPSIERELARHGTEPLDASARALPSPRDRALLIYTSGTTGLPKAANVTHGRIVEWSFWFAGMMDVTPDDRMYDCLPMYHSVGGIVAIGAMLVRGASVLIRARFSASRFWDDVADGNCTIFQYIGELCRYLTLAPPHPRENAHKLRLACGNGMQGDVWTKLQDRFGIPRILEFYAATEGSVSLYNCEGKPGAIGRVPTFLAHRFPVALIRCDPETGIPARNENGLCIPCAVDEPGEALGKILATPNAPARNFDGYTDQAASAKKILRDVFEKGDAWFRTGDLMRRDAAGYFYFVDRIGDTFRWKGENVSTTEVASVIRACPGVSDAAVFGVAIPGHEGRAGMAAITTDHSFHLPTLRAHLAAQLPVYARPLFVRLCAGLDMTGTFKLSKTVLAREGVSGASDPVWFDDRAAGVFVECDAEIVRSIADGSRRV